VLALGIAAVLDPAEASEVWHSFTETATAIAWACVGVFL
jgi:hypothetical protein